MQFEKGFMDLVVEELLGRQESLRVELRSRFKRTKPFRMEPVKDEDLLYDYNTKGFEIFRELYETQGEEVAMDYKNQMEQLRIKMEARNA